MKYILILLIFTACDSVDTKALIMDFRDSCDGELTTSLKFSEWGNTATLTCSGHTKAFIKD